MTFRPGFLIKYCLAAAGIPAVILRADGSFPTGENPFEIPTEIIAAGGESRLVRPPTGSGFYNVGTTVTAVWTSDPVVFFAGGGYTFTLERTFERFGAVNPGNIYRFFVGTNVALSDSVSLNLSFSDSITERTVQNGVKVANSSSNDARLTIGTSIGVSPDTSLLVSAGIGLTNDSPDFTFTVSMPLSFRGLF